jgi:hypothetical protein
MSFQLSVRVEPLFRNMTLPQQLEKVAEAKYHGFEFGNWRAADATEITKQKNRLGLKCAFRAAWLKHSRNSAATAVLIT